MGGAYFDRGDRMNDVIKTRLRDELRVIRERFAREHGHAVRRTVQSIPS